MHPDRRATIRTVSKLLLETCLLFASTFRCGTDRCAPLQHKKHLQTSSFTWNDCSCPHMWHEHNSVSALSGHRMPGPHLPCLRHSFSLSHRQHSAAHVPIKLARRWTGLPARIKHQKQKRTNKSLNYTGVNPKH